MQAVQKEIGSLMRQMKEVQSAHQSFLEQQLAFQEAQEREMKRYLEKEQKKKAKLQARMDAKNAKMEMKAMQREEKMSKQDMHGPLKLNQRVKLIRKGSMRFGECGKVVAFDRDKVIVLGDSGIPFSKQSMESFESIDDQNQESMEPRVQADMQFRDFPVESAIPPHAPLPGSGPLAPPAINNSSMIEKQIEKQKPKFPMKRAKKETIYRLIAERGDIAQGVMSMSLFKEYASAKTLVDTDVFVKDEKLHLPDWLTQFVASNAAKIASSKMNIPLLAVKLYLEEEKRYTGAGISLRDVTDYTFKFPSVEELCDI